MTEYHYGTPSRTRSEEIAAERLKHRLDRGDEFALLDTRPAADFEGWHLPDAEHDCEAFADYITDTVPEKPPNYERVTAIDRGQSVSSDDEEAIELELGPNRCAAE